MEVINGLLTALNTYGPTVAIVAALLVVNALFVWREWKREDKHTERIAMLEDKFEKTVTPIVIAYQTLVTDCKNCIMQNTRVIEKLIDRK